jgi:hypothetical protein
MLRDWVLAIIEDPIFCLGTSENEACVILIDVEFGLTHPSRSIYLLNTCASHDEDPTAVLHALREYIFALAIQHRSATAIEDFRLMIPRVSCSYLWYMKDP